MGVEGSSGCPFRRVTQSVFVRLVYLHALLFLTFIGFTSGENTATTPAVSAGAWSKCPVARASRFATTAFQCAPRPATLPLKAITSRAPADGARFSVAKSSSSFVAALPRTRNEHAESPLRRRRVRADLRMSAVDGQAAPAAAAVPAAASKADKAKRKENASQPMAVHVIGLSHHNAAVDVREKLAVPEAEWNLESARLCDNPNVIEAAVLSTCNRFEVYIAAADGHAAIRETIQALQERSGLDQATLRKSLFILSAEDAVWHLLRVSAGLDSLVVGEGQILSQVSCVSVYFV